MAKYRKKPVVIEAFIMGMDARPDWFQDKVTTNEIITYSMNPEAGPFERTGTYCDIKTLEGTMRGDYGDYIIKGIKGEIYPCKPDIFEQSYEIVVDETYKQKLREAHYPHGIIKDWDEDKCEAEWSALGENRMS